MGTSQIRHGGERHEHTSSGARVPMRAPRGLGWGTAGEHTCLSVAGCRVVSRAGPAIGKHTNNASHNQEVVQVASAGNKGGRAVRDTLSA